MRYILFGIAWGCTWLVGMGVLLSIWSPEAFRVLMSSYPLQALGAAAVGVASTLPARIYSVRRLPYLLRFLVHAGVALGVFFPVAFALGWIPYHPGNPGITILEIVYGTGIFFAIWLVFYLINRKEARRINERVRELRDRN